MAETVARNVFLVGATGPIGGALCNALLSRGHRVRTLTEAPHAPSVRALNARGVGLLVGALFDRRALCRGLLEADCAFLDLPPSERPDDDVRRARLFLEAAKEARLGHLVLVSVASAGRATCVPRFEARHHIEELVRRSELPHTILRPTLLMEKLQEPAALVALEDGRIELPLAPWRRVQLVSARDVAEVAVRAVEVPGDLLGRAVEIAADEPSGFEIAVVLSRVLKRPVTFAEVPKAALGPAGDDRREAALWLDEVGFTVDRERLLHDVPGLRLTDFETWAKAQDWGVLVQAQSPDDEPSPRRRQAPSPSFDLDLALARARLRHLFDAALDEEKMRALGLRAPPAPDGLLEVAWRLHVEPCRLAFVGATPASVRAARRAKVALIVGLSRDGRASLLFSAGAHLVASSLEAPDDPEEHVNDPRPSEDLPHALERFDEVKARISGRRLVVFLDYDGTLSPIVEDPAKAILDPRMQKALLALKAQVPLAIVSGRDRADVERRVGIKGIWYAGSHGFDIRGPSALFVPPAGEAVRPALDDAERALRERLADIPGALVDRKRFSLATHYRNVAAPDVPRVLSTVEEVARAHPELKPEPGKKVVDLKPRVNWDKGEAVRWILERMGRDDPAQYAALYLGDDVTDEAAFRALRGGGLGIRVGDAPHPTWAELRLDDTVDVERFLRRLAGP